MCSKWTELVLVDVPADAMASLLRHLPGITSLSLTSLTTPPLAFNLDTLRPSLEPLKSLVALSLHHLNLTTTSSASSSSVEALSQAWAALFARRPELEKLHIASTDDRAVWAAIDQLHLLPGLEHFTVTLLKGPGRAQLPAQQRSAFTRTRLQAGLEAVPVLKELTITDLLSACAYEKEPLLRLCLPALTQLELVDNRNTAHHSVRIERIDLSGCRELRICKVDLPRVSLHALVGGLYAGAARLERLTVGRDLTAPRAAKSRWIERLVAGFPLLNTLVLESERALLPQIDHSTLGPAVLDAHPHRALNLGLLTLRLPELCHGVLIDLLAVSPHLVTVHLQGAWLLWADDISSRVRLPALSWIHIDHAAFLTDPGDDGDGDDDDDDDHDDQGSVVSRSRLEFGRVAPNVERVELHNVAVDEVDVSGCAALEGLELTGGCEVSSIAAANAPALKKVELSLDKPHAWMQLHGCTALKTVTLRHEAARDHYQQLWG